MEYAWNADWWFYPGAVEDVFLSANWAGPETGNAVDAAGHTLSTDERAAAVGAVSGSVEHAGWAPVHLPHDMSGAPLNAFDEKAFPKAGCYAKALRKKDVEQLIRAAHGETGEQHALFAGGQPEASPDSAAAARDTSSVDGQPPVSDGNVVRPVIFLCFEGVSVSCRVWVNGVPAGGHRGAYTPFEIRIDPFLTSQGKEAEEQSGGLGGVGAPQEIDSQYSVDSLAWIIVEVDSGEDAGIPPFGGVVDYLVFGGIYRGVSLRAVAGAWVDSVYGMPRPRGDSLEGTWTVEITAETYGLTTKILEGCSLSSRLFCADMAVAEGKKALSEFSISEHSALETLRNTSSVSPSLSLDIEKPRLWDLDNPFLYKLEVSLCDQEGRLLDQKTIRVGFRMAEFGSSGFYLNRRRVFLRGLNRHQEYPYAGYAMGPDAQRRDAEILKHELGCTVVRTSHYPQSRHFLDACDELCLLVFEELPGWQHVGDVGWQKRAATDLHDMIIRDRNHPSIILWGVRINESMDNHEFYSRTNELAHDLDSCRATAGVRYLRHSELLEDVYTFNDFTCDGEDTPSIAEPSTVLPKRHEKAPYLITEHTGHMFPTKRFDQEERLVAHALRHARVLDAAMANERIAGCIGWCAFDYHTHKDFGSGDRVCYHGVADMFRIPKYAAFVYGSQVSPSERIVLEPASRFAKGERNAARMLPVHVFTNCDAVDLYRGEAFIARFFPDKTHFANLPHPPVVIDDLIGERLKAEGWSTRDQKLFRRLAGKAMAVGTSRLSLSDKLCMGLFMLRHRFDVRKVENLVIRYGMGWGSSDDSVRIVGILDGKEVAERVFGVDASARRLGMEADTCSLHVVYEEEWTSTRVVVRALDQYDNAVPFMFEPYTIHIEGPARLIGPAQRSLVGGAGAFWVAGERTKGQVIISVTSPRFEQPAVLELWVE